MGLKLASGPGGHPELGDTVYKSDGTKLGVIGFFYDMPRPDVFAVRVGEDEEDHAIVMIKRFAAVDEAGVDVPGAFVLVRINEAFIDNNARRGVGKPIVAIDNNTNAAVKFVIPPGED